MTKPQKVSAVIVTIMISVASLTLYNRKRIVDKKINKCPLYTVGKITRIYTLRGFIYAEYNYLMGDKMVKVDEGVNDYDLNESVFTYMNKLKKRRYFFLEVSCKDIYKHRLVWHTNVPGTLRHIPRNGWSIRPIWAKNSP